MTVAISPGLQKLLRIADPPGSEGGKDNGLLIFGTQRLVRALLPDPILSTIASLVVVMSPVPYGGLGIFHVFEAFFTPRLISCSAAAGKLESPKDARCRMRCRPPCRDGT